MDSKKPSSGMLRHLRKKMVPHLWRGRANKLPAQLDPTLDLRMSSSVPDVRDMKQAFAYSPSRSRAVQPDFPGYASSLATLAKPPGGATDSGRGLLAGQVTRRSEHRRSAPSDCPDWASSQELHRGRGEDESTSSGSASRSMELAQPQVLPSNQETSQDSPQVQLFEGRGSLLPAA